MAHGCSLPPIISIFSILSNDLFKKVEQAELEIQLSSGKTVGGMLFCIYLGINNSEESLQKLINIVYIYCSKLNSKLIIK